MQTHRARAIAWLVASVSALAIIVAITVQSPPFDSGVAATIPSNEFGRWYIELSPGQSTNRFCPPSGSYSRFTRADNNVGVTYWMTPLGSNKEIPILRPPGTDKIALGEFECVRVEARSRKLSMTIKIVKQPTE